MADSKKKIPPKVISREMLAGAQEALKALPKTPERDTYNGFEVIRALFDDILRLRLNGYTYSEIKNTLEQSGITISKNTLQRYFKKFEHINLGIKSVAKKKKKINNNTDNNDNIDDTILNNTEETEEQINEDEDEKKRKEDEEKKRKGKKQKLEQVTGNGNPFGNEDI